jgi:AAA+ superfamily predicted ATPase
MSELHDLTALIRGGTPLIVIETPDEARVIDLFRHVLLNVMRPLYRWSVTEGLRRFDMDIQEGVDVANDFNTLLRSMHGESNRSIYLALDAHPYLEYAGTQRMLRDLCERRGCAAHTLVMVGQKIVLPEAVESLAVRFQLRLPDENNLRRVVQDEINLYVRENNGRRVTIDNTAQESLIRNLRGLSLSVARRFARQLIFADGAISPADLPALNKLKFELLNQSGHLHYEYDTADFAEVIGLNRLKRWLQQRRAAFSGEALPAGLPAPKGVLLLGVQGCGKSLAAKAVAGVFQVPLLRLDVGGLYNKYHGETEKNLRDALASAEQLAPCVLWMDEIEKGLSSSGDSDGGVSRRILGYFLTWMAERKAQVFLVATANDVSALPPEFLRKGRFDEIFFVDLPDHSTRAEIFRLHMEKRQIQWDTFSLDNLAASSNGFSGAEIEQAIVSGLYTAFADKQLLSEKHLLSELSNTRPLSVLMAEKVEQLREWAKERTVPAD